MDRPEFLSIINDGNFDLLKGKPESDWLECKRQKYLLDEEKGKRELAKDISSFANSTEGGFILIGVETEKSDQYQVDTIAYIRPFAQNIINIEQYHNVIRDWVYPAPDTKIEWKSYKQSNKGILVITIPPQSEGLKPFLVSKTIEDSGKFTEILFGYVERKRANSVPKKVVELHQIFRDGLFYGTNISRRFDDITALFSDSRMPNVSPKRSDEEISVRITDSIMSSGLNGHRKLIIAVYTREEVSLPEWFDSGSELIKSFENPPELRRSGWGLNIRKRSNIIKGELRRTVNEEKHLIFDLYRDGTLIFGVPAEQDFLTWGPAYSDLKINSLALIETIYNFLTLYKVVTENLFPKPLEFYLRIKLHDLHLNGENSFMVPYAVGAYSGEKYDAPENDFDRILTFGLSNFDVGSVAYMIVREIYAWFGMDSNVIPYVSEKDDLKFIDPTQIINTKR